MMMAVAASSPTPFSSGGGGIGGGISISSSSSNNAGAAAAYDSHHAHALPRRPAAAAPRQVVVRDGGGPVRPNLKRRSPLSLVSTLHGHGNGHGHGNAAALAALGAHELGDSSEDEGSAPLLSAAAEELLGLRTEERPGAVSRLGGGGGGGGAGGAGSGGAAGRQNWSEYAAGSPVRRENARSAVSGRDSAAAAAAAAAVGGSPAAAVAMFRTSSPRVVRLSRHSPGDSGSLRRTASTSSVHDGSPLQARVHTDLKTPAPRPKSALGESGLSSAGAASSGKYMSATSLGRSTGGGGGGGMSGSRQASGQKEMSEAQDHALNGTSNAGWSKNEESGAHNSIRIKRFGKMTGSILGAKPARRGMIRRPSEEEQSPTEARSARPADEPAPLSLQEEGQPDYSQRSSPAKQSPQPGSNHVRFASSAEVATIPREESRIEAPVASSPPPKKTVPENASAPEFAALPLRTSSLASAPPADAAPKQMPPSFKVPPPLPSLNDQENEPPPTFKRNKPGADVLGSRPMHAPYVDKVYGRTPGTGSPVRKVLGPRSQNTPLRPAPPPPKMTVLETATAAAGAASASQMKKKSRNYISVNGKLFTRMECIGRGGSGRVYRVMAENFKLFALKRVSLEDVDEVAIRGFKGEIDLLRQLENVERVVRLYDYEINDEKKTLSVLMDIGEMDLKKMLDPRLDEHTGKFDVTFTRYIWKEMLECVQAIHRHDIVHSDLKPANFVLIQGRLKLIDFGIANAIQDDTVNVHREQQIGTPNYMAPEALLDTNALSSRSNPGAHSRSASQAKLMKLGKPSDVWSLGCILYQIVYGKPPFGHIANQMSKVLAITDRAHAIAFPDLGLGRVPVPTGLVRTLRKCLSRDPAARPDLDSLLAERDLFLHPDAPGTVPVSQELLKRLQLNVLRIVEKDGLPDGGVSGIVSGGVSGGVNGGGGGTGAGARLKEEAVADWLDKWAPQLFASMKAAVEKGTA